MRIWVVCGAGRGVGKTHLALALTDLLDRAVYAKRGHSPRRPDGPPNYFRSEADLEAFVVRGHGRFANVVLESNAWARDRRAEMVIYLEGGDRVLEPRPDRAQLRAAARIVIDPSSEAGGGSVLARADWDAALGPIVPEASRRRLVIDRLVAQWEYLRRESRLPHGRD